MRSRESSPRQLRVLLVLNAMLLMVLAVVTFGPTAGAQTPVRGEYTMVAGGVNGSDSGAVYIVDTINRELMAITFDHNTRSLSGIGYRNLATDASTLARR